MVTSLFLLDRFSSIFVLNLLNLIKYNFIISLAMRKIGLLYWPKGGSVERSAEKIQGQLKDKNVVFKCIDEVQPNELLEFDSIIMGGSTVGADHWGNNENQNEWTFFFSELKKAETNLEGKEIALFGLGNQMLYPDHFADDIAVMRNELAKANATFVGNWPTEGYDFNHSDAVENDQFIGLVLDEDAQPELTDERISGWLKQINF
ncbi:flavodoxin [Prolixibacteraceae bacterium JC049]|nr:flavodoxin [Prolixibacteraceae bacterium JC049]